MLCDLELSFILLITTMKGVNLLVGQKCISCIPAFTRKPDACTCQLTSIFVHLLSQGFLDIDLTDLRKGGANITGFQLVNNSEPSVSRVVQQWMEFDIKDSKMPKSGLKVLVPLLCLLFFSFGFTLLATHKAIKRHEMC